MNIVNQLVRFGLSGREAKVYSGLLRGKDFTALELQRLVEIPRTKVYEVLHQLIGKGFCVEKKVGSVTRYEAISPDVGLNGLIKKYRNKTENEKMELKKKLEIKNKELKVTDRVAKKTLSALIPIYERGRKDGHTDSREYVEVLKGGQQIAEKVFELEREVKNEIVGFSKPPFALADSAGGNTEELGALGRGVKVKAIYEYNGKNRKDFLKVVESYVSAGEEARIVKESPLKMLVFDEKKVITLMQDPVTLNRNSLTAVVMEHQDSVKAFKRLFEYVWEEATPFEQFKIKGGV